MDWLTDKMLSRDFTVSAMVSQAVVVYVERIAISELRLKQVTEYRGIIVSGGSMFVDLNHNEAFTK